MHATCFGLYLGHPHASQSFSSTGTTAHCGLWPVEKYPSIFSYLPTILSIISLPAHASQYKFLFYLPFYGFHNDKPEGGLSTDRNM